MKLHMVVSGPDEFGYFRTRCGKESLRLGLGHYDSFKAVAQEGTVTCSGCKLTLSAPEKTVLRLMHQHGAARFVSQGGTTTWTAERGLTVYGSVDMMRSLVAKRLVSGADRYKLTAKGRVVAKALPIVKEEF